MEGLVPFVYRTIVQYRNGGQTPPGTSWFDESSSSASYMRLLGDSGRYQPSEMHFFSSPAPTAPTLNTTPPPSFASHRLASRS